MDRPTRESYTVAVVAPDERSAAQGVIGFARSVASIASPYLTGLFLSAPALINLPFILAGGLKITYDLLLYKVFIAIKPPEEHAQDAAPTSRCPRAGLPLQALPPGLTQPSCCG
jgi:hypothetical protein